MPAFPGEAWFEAVRDLYNNDASLHSGGGGACDTRAGLRMDDQIYLIAFEGHECSEIRPIDESELGNLDFYLQMETAQWVEMIANIQQNGAADRDHTLNTLDLDLELVRTADEDQYKTDLFYRYNQNFQDFFDASSRIKTTFEDH